VKPQAPFSIDAALAMILRHLPASARQHTVPIVAALGRVSASAVLAPGDQPRFDSAAMDGWVVAGEHAAYRVVGESRAGAAYRARLRDGEAVAISTGAVVPPGAAALIRREQGREAGGVLSIAAYAPGRDVRPRGCDFRAGDVLLGAGQVIGHLDIARVAAAGIATLAVRADPKIALLATGDEITPGGQDAGPDGNYDALSPAILARLGGGARHLGIVRDLDGAIVERVAGCDADAVIVIGGASGGRHDRVRHALGELGLQVMVPSVAMRPGKPFWCGVMDGGRMVFGLPGNPVAALVALELFVLPALAAMAGASVERDWVDLVGEAPMAGSYARVRFALWRLGGKGLEAQPLGQGDSAALMPLAGANGLIRYDGIGAQLLPLMLTPYRGAGIR